MKNCLLVDDLPEALAMMSDAVSTAFPQADQHQATRYQHALCLIRTQPFDLALIDLVLDEGHGVDLISRLQREQPACIPIVTSILDDDDHLFLALQAGAQGYLLKDYPTQVLSMQLQRIGQGELPMAPRLARRLMEHFKANHALKPTEAHGLSSRELDVLKLLAQGLSTVKAAQALGISRHTAADHVKAIYRKLNINNRAEAALRARTLGLVKI